MCRGCSIKKSGESTVDEYLEWLDEYHQVIWKMKSLEKKIHAYARSVDSREHETMLDGLHKAMVKTRKKYAKLDADYLGDV